MDDQDLLPLLSTWPVARLATVTEQGKPHQVPIVFVLHDGRLYSPIDGKPKRTAALQRLRNLAVHPECCLLLDDYRDNWEQLWWLRLDGVARYTEPSTTEAQTVTNLLREKYPQYSQTPVHRDPSHAGFLCFEWRNVRSWGKLPA